MKTRVYISGPMSHGDRIDNLAAGLKAMRELANRGYAPLCPHLTFFAEPFVSLPHDVWVAMDLSWVAVSDCMLRLPGESPGADKEELEAGRWGVPVYYDLDELCRYISPEWEPEQQLASSP